VDPAGAGLQHSICPSQVSKCTRQHSSFPTTLVTQRHSVPSHP
jgi:hypothetical protein